MESFVRASKIFDAQAIPVSDSVTSSPVQMAPASALALHLTSITGTTPSVTFTYSLGISEDGPWTIPQSPVTIGATKSAVDVMDFAPECAGWIKIIATNNSGANIATITAYLAVQESN